MFVEPMRERKFVTQIDAYHSKYGKTIAGSLSLVSVITDIVTLAAGLGKTPYTLISIHAYIH